MIDEEAELELIGNSRVVLMDDAGRMISLTLGGRYPLKDLSLSEASDSSMLFKSIWDEYFEVYDQGISVQEQLLSESFTKPGFELSIPSSSQIFGSRQMIEWPYLLPGGYEVRLINQFGEVFKTLEQEKPMLDLDLLQPELVWKTEISIQVISQSGRQSPLYALHKLSPPDYEDMDRLLKKEFAGDQFEVQLTKAAFFENQWLFADAQTVLQQLRKQYGTLIDDFWKQYLYRNGFYAMSRL